MVEAIGQPTFGTGLLVDVEIVEKGIAITEDPEHAASDSAAWEGGYAEIELFEVQDESVTITQIDRERIAEIPISFA